MIEKRVEPEYGAENSIARRSLLLLAMIIVIGLTWDSKGIDQVGSV